MDSPWIDHFFNFPYTVLILSLPLIVKSNHIYLISSLNFQQTTSVLTHHCPVWKSLMSQHNSSWKSSANTSCNMKPGLCTGAVCCQKQAVSELLPRSDKVRTSLYKFPNYQWRREDDYHKLGQPASWSLFFQQTINYMLRQMMHLA